MKAYTLRQLQAALSHIDTLLQDAVINAQATQSTPNEALRGLVITEEDVQADLARSPLSGLWDDNSPPVLAETLLNADVPFAHLARTFQLTQLDAYILLLALAPEYDRRYERLYAYLQDDVLQRRPTINLAMNLLGRTPEQRFAVWERLQPHMPLRAQRLLDCIPDRERSQTPFLGHHLKADYRIVAYLLGSATADERIQHGVLPRTAAGAPVTTNVVGILERTWDDSPIYFFKGADENGQMAAALLACGDASQDGIPLAAFDLAQLAAGETHFELAWALVLREGYLNDAALLLTHWEASFNENSQFPPAPLWRALVEYPRPVFLCGGDSWEPVDVERGRRMIAIDFPLPDYEHRLQTWDQALRNSETQLAPQALDELASKYRFTHGQILRAVHSAADRAAARGETIVSTDLVAGAQVHASLSLGRYAKKITPRYTWKDLILPADRLEQLQEICARVRYAHVVQQEWGFAQKVSPVAGVTSLFAGDSGTGKTMSAEVIAQELGLVMYKIDLSAVVSKYIGETEKNLSAIFEEAHASNAILFFDEADALFGKRSEVKDAHDRYANIEVAYLLQQMESYDGVAIMATNLRQNLDEAFTRRLDFMIDFPFPEKEFREQIWAAHLPPSAPLSKDVNLREIADQYRLAGGNIRNAAIASAYLAAADGGVITSQHIRSAVRREHQKMGRLLD